MTAVAPQDIEQFLLRLHPQQLESQLLEERYLIELLTHLPALSLLT
jgi:hypothetical protein